MSPIEVELNLFVTIRSFGARNSRRLDNWSSRVSRQQDWRSALGATRPRWGGPVGLPALWSIGYRLSGQARLGEVFDKDLKVEVSTMSTSFQSYHCQTDQRSFELMNQSQGSGCSTAVEHITVVQNSWGRGFEYGRVRLFFSLLYPISGGSSIQVPHRGVTLLIFLKICLAMQLEAKQA